MPMSWWARSWIPTVLNSDRFKRLRGLGIGYRQAGRRSWGKVLVALAVLAAVLVAGTLTGFRVAAAFRETDRASDLAPSSGRFIETAGGRMFVQETGPGDGTPVVLIHGTGAWSELWRPIMDRLGAEGFRVIALDIPPFGFSDRPTTPSYGRGDQAQRIAGVLGAMKVDSAYLVGHSFGAGPTVETVLRFPGKVRGLVLVAGALGLSQAGTGGPPVLLAWLLDRGWLRDSFVAASATNPLATRFLLSKMIYRKESADRQAVEILQRPMTLANSTRDLGAWLKHFLSAPPDSAALSADRRHYIGITVPTVLIWGDKDSLTPLDQGRDLNGLINGSILRVMPEVGHIPQLEDPSPFGNILIDALRSMKHT
jgi:pimeloyl-ACP methyl ester carboxylesterase